MKKLQKGFTLIRRKEQTKGFTLIELLVVIAVIGVLAAVVLLAINPLEQINRGQDAGRKDRVAQLGNAAQAYFTSIAGPSTVSTYPPDIATLVASGDLKNDPNGAGPAIFLYCANNSGTAGCTAAPGCAATTGSECKYMVAYTKTLSQQSATQATQAGAGTCTPTTTYFAYSVSGAVGGVSKAGWYCGTVNPNPGQTVF